MEFDANTDDKITVKINAVHRAAPSDSFKHSGALPFEKPLQIEADGKTTLSENGSPKHKPYFDLHGATLSGVLEFGIITDDPILLDDFASFSFVSDAVHVPIPASFLGLLGGLALPGGSQVLPRRRIDKATRWS